MPEAPPLSPALALRIEQIVASNVVKETPLSMRFGETLAGKTTGGRDRNWVFCFGNQDLDRLDDILAFYAADGQQPHFSLTPMRFTREVAAALTAASFSQQGYEQALLYGLPEPASVPLPPSVTIERVTPDTLDEFVRVTAAGFEWPAAWRDAAMDGVRRSFTPQGHHFLARFAGDAAGVATLSTDADGVAGLSNAAVILTYRRKGIHLALIRHRLVVAHELGCTLVIGGADFSSASFRNQQRAGLRLAYVESAWSR